MSFKGLFHDKKGEQGSISRRTLEAKLNYSCRPQRTIPDLSSFPSIDAFKRSCWANMPPELLRDVLIRIESSDSTWPSRRNVVVCAGVCKTWREITKDIVKPPEFSGRITFPISLKQPGPRNALLQCYIKRNRHNQTYFLYLDLNQASNNDGKFLLAARRCRRPTCTDYIISLNSGDASRGSNTYVGKLRSNFLGTKFTIFDAQPPNAETRVVKSHSYRFINSKQVSPRIPMGNYPIAQISYELNVLGSRGPRRMVCSMDGIPSSSMREGGSAPTQTEFFHHNVESSRSIPFFRSISSRVESSQRDSTDGRKAVLMLRNKAPRWHEQLQCWCLNFSGRVTVASVKNFQMVAYSEDGYENDTVVLQFGKVGKDVFTMDFQYPISAFQAFAICLSSFDTKMACE